MRQRLLKRLIKTELLLRDQGTFLGFLWTLLNPIILFATLYFVFSQRLSEGSTQYEGYLLTGLLLWNFFSTASAHGASSITRRSNYISCTPLPPALFIISSIVALLLTALLESLLAFCFLSFHFEITLSMILYYLAGLGMLSLLAIGVASYLSIARIFFSDVSHVWGLMLRIGFFLTPIFYTLQSVDQRYAQYIYLNPLTSILSYARSPFIDSAATISSSSMAVATVLISCFTLSGILLTQRFRYRYVEG